MHNMSRVADDTLPQPPVIAHTASGGPGPLISHQISSTHLGSRGRWTGVQGLHDVAALEEVCNP
jgi:hypothetical protein